MYNRKKNPNSALVEIEKPKKNSNYTYVMYKCTCTSKIYKPL